MFVIIIMEVIMLMISFFFNSDTQKTQKCITVPNLKALIRNKSFIWDVKESFQFIANDCLFKKIVNDNS